MPVDRNQSVARRIIADVWNYGDLTVAGALLDLGLVNHDPDGPSTDCAGFVHVITSTRAVTPGIRFSLDGTFTPTEPHWREGESAAGLTARLPDRTCAAGALRRDLEVGDISLVFEQLAAGDVGDAARSTELRHRYLALFLTALRDNSSPLPGPPPTWEEIRNRWAS